MAKWDCSKRASVLSIVRSRSRFESNAGKPTARQRLTQRMRKLMSAGLRVLVRELPGRMTTRPLRLMATSLVSLAFIVFFVFYFSINLHNDDNSDNSKYLAFDQQPNTTWVKLRKELLAKQNAKSKVVLVGYMRGGTSLFSEIFNLDPGSTVFWHEPMDAFYQSYAALQPHSVPLTLLYHKNFTRRILSDHERNGITDYLYNLLNCRPENIPMLTFAHYHISYSSALKSIATCMEAKMAKFLIANCTNAVSQICGHVDLIRRDMSICTGNRCPDIISAVKSLLQGKPLVGSSRNQVDITKSPISRESLLSKLLSRFSPRHFGENVSQTTDRIALILERQLCLTHLESRVSDCIEPAFNTCRSAKLSALKVIRVMINDLEELVQRIPDIHVIYYVRDPRATAMSRSNPMARLTMSNVDPRAVAETRILCQRMADDLEARKRIERKYPGSISMVRYEDFIRRPGKRIEEVFKTIGRPPPADIHKWIESRFGGGDDNGFYGTVRKDPLMTSGKWMSETNLKDAMEMDKYCHEVLRELGYLTLSPSNT